MDDVEDPGNVFAIPDFWSKPQFWHDTQDPPSILFATPRGLEEPIEGKITDDRVESQLFNGIFEIPDFSFIPASRPPTSSSSTTDEDVSKEKKDLGEDHLFDIWKLEDNPPPEAVRFLSWDSFENGLENEHYSAYITEAGSEVFDAALADTADILQLSNTRYVVIQSGVYAESLLALGLGRGSILFSWDDDKKTFVQALDHMRIPGCTGETVDGLLAIFMSCGNKTRALKEYVDETYTSHKSPSRIALADAVSNLLSTLQSHLTVPRFALISFLQLQACFRPAEILLASFHAIVAGVSLEMTDEAILSYLFDTIQQMEHRTDSMRSILLEVLSRVSRPFLDFAGEWLGLQREAGVPLDKMGPGRGFVKVEDRSWLNEQGLEMHEPDFVFNNEALPSFIPAENAQTMFETGKSLRFLRTQHPEHPLSRAGIISIANPPELNWNFTWEDIEEVERKALKYERDLTETLHQFANSSRISQVSEQILPQKHNADEVDIFSKSKEEVEAYFLMSVATLNYVLPGVVKFDNLSSMMSQILAQTDDSVKYNAIFAPPISLTPVLSFGPIIAAQARIVNGTSMRLLFKSHNLRDHLSIQRRFQLMGDGVFSSKLAHALFDPELDTAERQAGVARSGGIVGLRLEGRENWPPATSELRLALMGILTETYTSGLPSENADDYESHKKELPGALSFGVREMSPEEIEKCINPHSVEALDFLRLSYKPPTPLEAVITPLSLYKYDQIFKLLLRITRMLYVVSQLFRDATDRTSFWRGVDTTAQRFRFEAHHFITCVSSYFFATGIETTWQIFERKLDEIERRINGDNTYAILGENEGLDKLREYHERVLDRITFALLLRKRQQAVMKLLEDIFGLVLGFSKYSRSRAFGVTRKVGQDEEVKAMYIRFRKKVEVFITVCKGLSEKKGYGERRFVHKSEPGGLFDSEELKDENTVIQLLALLEMSNYYSQPVVL